MQGNGIQELRCDRRNIEALKTLEVQPHYDAIVDFCAYEPGDIQAIFDNLQCSCDRYIYVSTPDVTIPSKDVRNEESPVMELEPEDDGVTVEAKLFSARRTDRAVLNRLRMEAGPAKEEPQEKSRAEPGLPAIGMDGKTKDGAMPYEILRNQLDFLK